jgi:DNA-binding response OmpR family regulator
MIDPQLIINGQAVRIIIVENEGHTAMNVADLLALEGARADVLGAAQAMAQAQERQPHLALIDHNLGGHLRGNVVAQRLIDLHLPTVRVSFSGASSQTTGERIDERLFDAVIRKGLSDDELIDRIRQLLATHAVRVGLSAQEDAP